MRGTAFWVSTVFLLLGAALGCESGAVMGADVSALADGGGFADLSSADLGPAEGGGPLLRPEPAFFEGFEGPLLTLEFKGLLNSAEDQATGRSTVGLGRLVSPTVKGPQVTSEQLTASLYRMPDDYEVEAMRGADYVLLQATQTLEAGAASGRYRVASLGFPVAAFVEMVASDDLEGALPAEAWATVYVVELAIRTDGASFSRYCPESRRDPASARSGVFLNPWHLAAFAPGEDLRLWAAIEMEAPIATPPEGAAEGCLHYIGDDEVSADLWQRERLRDGAELDCPLPEGYLDPRPAPSHLAFRLVAPLADLAAGGDEPLLPGIAQFTLVLDDEPREAADYRILAGRYRILGTDLLYVQTIGDVETLDPERFRLRMSETYIVTAAVAALTEGGATLTNTPSAFAFRTTILDVEEKYRAGDYVMRSCPVAVTDPATRDSSLFVCWSATEANTDPFAPGETLQLAGNQALTSDPATIQAVTGGPTACSCTDSTGASIDCAEYEAF